MSIELSLESYFISLFGLNPDHSTYITVIDLSGLPSEVTTVCIGVLLRLCFDYCYWDISLRLNFKINEPEEIIRFCETQSNLNDAIKYLIQKEIAEN